MSIDYPDYQQIREKSKRLGWLWRIGDIGYYVGVLGAILLLLTSLGKIAMMYFVDHVAIPRGLYMLALFGFVGCILLFFASGWLKDYACRKAKIR